MKNRKITAAEKMRVIGYCEFVTLLIAAIFVNIKLAIALLALSPIIIMIIVGLKDKNFHFFENDSKEVKDIIKKEFCA